MEKEILSSKEADSSSCALVRTVDQDKAHLVELIRRWGGLASDALLDPACKFFSLPSIEGIIGYRTIWGCSVVFGDPVCSPSEAPQLAEAFHQSHPHKNIIYLITSENFAKWAIQHVCKVLVEFGDEFFVDPHCDPRAKQGDYARLVRRKVRHALNEKVIVKEYLAKDPWVEQQLKQVGLLWLKSRHGPQVHLSHLDLFDHCFGKRWFYAQQGENIRGMAVLNQMQSQQGWLLNHLMTISEAAHGTQELLIVSILETLQSEGCHFLSFGPVPADYLKEVRGLSKFSTWVARQLFLFFNKIFRLKGHKIFWDKFYSQVKPSYLLFSQPFIGLREITALTRAMNVSLRK